MDVGIGYFGRGTVIRNMTVGEIKPVKKKGDQSGAPWNLEDEPSKAINQTFYFFLKILKDAEMVVYQGRHKNSTDIKL